MGEPPIIASGSRKKWENGSRREKERKSGAKRGKGEKGGDLRLRRPSVRMMEKRVWLKKIYKKRKKGRLVAERDEADTPCLGETDGGREKKS